MTQSVISIYPEHAVRKNITFLDVHKMFTSIKGAEDNYCSNKRPFIEAWLNENPHIKPEEVIMLSDTRYDFEDALALGIECLLFNDSTFLKCLIALLL